MYFFLDFIVIVPFLLFFLFFKKNSNFLILKLKDKKCFNFKINRLYNLNHHYFNLIDRIFQTKNDSFRRVT